MQSYTTVTEVPGSRVTAEQLAMFCTRYRLAADLSKGKDVLEVACGPGIGLGYLGRHARRVVGGDYDEVLLGYARATYGNGIRVLRLDAGALPFASQSFEVVILLEALYYLDSPEQVIEESRRVLRPEGTLVISIPNRDWPGFNPSPFTHRYFSVPALHTLLASKGFATRISGGFPVSRATPRDRLLTAARRLAVRLHLIPSTMKGKELVKRLVFGTLSSLPHELRDGMAEPSPLVPLAASSPTSAFKVLYAVGRLP